MRRQGIIARMDRVVKPILSIQEHKLLDPTIIMQLLEANKLVFTTGGIGWFVCTSVCVHIIERGSGSLFYLVFLLPEEDASPSGRAEYHNRHPSGVAGPALRSRGERPTPSGKMASTEENQEPLSSGLWRLAKDERDLGLGGLGRCLI